MKYINLILCLFIILSVAFYVNDKNVITEQALISYAAIFWALLNLASVLLFLILWRTQRQTAFLLYAIAYTIKAAWGVTVPGLGVESVKIINSIIIPPLASLISFYATYTLLVSVSKEKI